MLRAIPAIIFAINGSLATRSSAENTLYFTSPDRIEGQPGTLVEIPVEVWLSAESFVQGYSLSIDFDAGMSDFELTDATIEETDTERLISNGLEKTDVVDPENQGQGVVSAVVLSFTQPITFDPDFGPAKILRMKLTGTLPAEGNGAQLVFDFKDDKQATGGQPVQNVLTVAGATVRPETRSHTILVGEGITFPKNARLKGAENLCAEGAFGQRYIFNTGGPIENFSQAQGLIKQASDDPQFSGSFVDVSQPEVNHSAAGNQGQHLPDLPYPSAAMAAGCCQGSFIQYSIGYIQIEQAGSHTIGIDTEQGFGLRISGWDFTSLTGKGIIDPTSSDSIICFKGGENIESLANAEHVQPGIYRVEFFWWGDGPSSHGELSIARGSTANPGIPLGREPLGIPGYGLTGVKISSLGPHLTEGIDFTSSPNPHGGSETGLSNFSEVRSALDNPLLDPTISCHQSINFVDPEHGEAGRFAGDLPFPLDTWEADDDFLMTFEGSLEIPATGSYLIGFQGDDGSYLRIPSQSFSDLVENATGDTTIDEDGSRIICDRQTSNSSSVGRITLSAGTHPFSGAYFERGGGAHFEVFGIEEGSSRPALITSGAARIGGARLVPPPQRPLITSLQVFPDTDEITLTWISNKNSHYSLRYGNNLDGPFSDLTTNIEAGLGNENPERTTFGPFSNPSPNARKGFFQVVPMFISADQGSP